MSYCIRNAPIENSLIIGQLLHKAGSKLWYNYQTFLKIWIWRPGRGKLNSLCPSCRKLLERIQLKWLVNHLLAN